jgi:membrane protein DedA with SNARE-associated domain
MTAVITRFGLLGVFLLMVPESAGVPIPSEVTLLFSGFAVHQGWMSFPLAVLAATAGNLVGSLMAYGVGATGLTARMPLVGVQVDRWGALIERRGTSAVFIARLLPLARTFISLPAGGRHVPLGRFVALSTAGCALWAFALVLAGVLAGSAWTVVRAVLSPALLVLGIAVVVATLLFARRR